MAWVDPPTLTRGTKITADMWNQYITTDLALLSQHAHSGNPGDGAALVGLTPIGRQSFQNVGTLCTFFSRTYVGGLLGPNGSWGLHLSFLAANASGGNRTVTATLAVGGSTLVTANSDLLSSVANSRVPLSVDACFSNTGAQNAQRVKILIGPDNLGTSFVAGSQAASGNLTTPAWNTFAIDTSVPFTVSFGITMSAADFMIESVLGYVIGPMYGA